MARISNLRLHSHYALMFGSEIRPDKYTIIVQTVQLESKKGSIQDSEKDLEKTEKELQKAKDKLDNNDDGKC